MVLLPAGWWRGWNTFRWYSFSQGRFNVVCLTLLLCTVMHLTDRVFQHHRWQLNQQITTGIYIEAKCQFIRLRVKILKSILFLYRSVEFYNDNCNLPTFGQSATWLERLLKKSAHGEGCYCKTSQCLIFLVDTGNWDSWRCSCRRSYVVSPTGHFLCFLRHCAWALRFDFIWRW